ncbi:MAG: chemotaxis protein CheC [Rhodoferax sp.]
MDDRPQSQCLHTVERGSWSHQKGCQTMMELTELQRDALTEMFNIGVGAAADLLSQMVGEPVRLSVPLVEFTSESKAKAYYLEREQRPLCAIRQTYVGEVNTDALLMFPEENSLELVRIMVGADLPVQTLTEMEQDAMAEIGNIILNAVISSMATTLALKFEGALPQVSILSAEDLFVSSDPAGPADEEGSLMALNIDFFLSARKVSGYLAFLLDLPSGTVMLQRIDAYIAQGAV